MFSETPFPLSCLPLALGPLSAASCPCPWRPLVPSLCQTDSPSAAILALQLTVGDKSHRPRLRGRRLPAQPRRRFSLCSKTWFATLLWRASVPRTARLGPWLFPLQQALPLVPLNEPILPARSPELPAT